MALQLPGHGPRLSILVAFGKALIVVKGVFPQAGS
jgi:hypothetical protein